MKIEIKRFNVRKNKMNEVTSSKVFKARRCKDQAGNWRFNPQGIFSKEIFGEFGSCSCGATRTPGQWCPECGCRVISKSKMPDFYIPCEVQALFINANLDYFGKNAKSVESLLRYKSFYYDGEIIEADLSVIDLASFDQSKVFIGVEAVKEMGVPISDTWIGKNMISDIPIPHPIYRPLIELNKGYVIGPLNTLLVDILTKRAQILSFQKFNEDNKLGLLVMSKLLSEKYNEVMQGMFGLIVTGKKSFIHQEIIAQSITGAVRAVITTNVSLKEDEVLIGCEFAETLFPHLYKKSNGDIDTLNNLIREGNYHVLANRPPTISEKSIIAMKPIFGWPNDDLGETVVALQDESGQLMSVLHEGRECGRFVCALNPIVLDGLSGDLDGDVLLFVALYTKKANREAENRLPSRIFIGANDGEIRNKIPEDFIFTMQNIINS